MLNAIQSWLLDQSVVEKEVYEARTKAKTELTRQLGSLLPQHPEGRLRPSDEAPTGQFPGIIYDEYGRPRPAPMAYDGPYSDVPARTNEEDVADDDSPFPFLDKPLG